MRINHNIAALNTYRQLTSNNAMQNKSLEKLSSGMRINRAADDAAGLAISEKMRGQIRGLEQASRNSQDAISMIQTAEGGLNEIHSILQRIRELAVQAANDTNVTADRSAIADEITQLKEEIDRISDTTEFNSKKLLNGDLSKGTTAQAQILQIATGIIKGTAGTQLTAVSLLTGIQDSNGNSLGIQIGDVITIRGTLNGSIKTATITISSGATIDNILSAFRNTFLAKSAVVTAGLFRIKTTTGQTASIGAISITAADSSGTERTAFNNAFGNLTQTQAAKNASSNTEATMQIGANARQTMTVDINDMDTTSLGLDAVSVATSTAAQVSISAIDEAIELVSDERAKIGAIQNRLEHTINNLDTSAENIQASESRIRDVDMAKEMMMFTKLNILAQASQAMLAQANQQPQSVLQLLR